MLIDLEYLKQLFREEESLGHVSLEKETVEGKQISIPRGKFKIFNADFDAKKKRIKNTTKNDSDEKNFYTSWFEQYEEKFNNIVDKNDVGLNDIRKSS